MSKFCFLMQVTSLTFLSIKLYNQGMYFNADIVLDNKKLPEMLREDFADLERFYNNGDWFNYGLTLENSVPSIKAFYSNGTIDSEMFSLIRKKFGIA